MERTLETGLKGQKEILVEQEHTAASVGSGDLPVFATPALASVLEGAAVKALEGHLPPGMTTVGISLTIEHSAATPVGGKVIAQAELTEIRGRHLIFSLTARDEQEIIGQASHERVMVQRDRFLQKVKEKG